MELENICIVASKIVAEVGSFVRDEFKNFDVTKIEKKGFNDLVSYVDKEAEEALVEELEMLMPEAGFITEEGTKSEESEYEWCIDPLDGTTNFTHGLPLCCVSVALLHNKKPVVGVIYEIMKDELFYAWKGGGAYHNVKEINVSYTDRMSNSLLATGFPYNDFDRTDDYLKILKEYMEKSHGLRRLGSAALDLAYVAIGRFEGFYEYNLNSWDVAAGVLIVQEAGGKVTDFKGEENSIFGKEILATNKFIHQEMQDVINKHW